MHQPAGKLFDAADDDATAQASAAAMPAVDAHSGRHLLAVFSVNNFRLCSILV